MLTAIPTTKHLSRVYFELSKIGAQCIGSNFKWPYRPKNREELIVLACEMSRFDPRLFEILVSHLIRRWRDINPTTIRSCYKEMEYPQTAGIIAEFMKGALASDEEAVFFAEYLMKGLKPVPLQFYFYNLYAPGGMLARRATEEGIYEFKKWGFIAYERPVINEATRAMAGSFDVNSRFNILRRLFAEKGEIRLKDYLQAVKFSISRQQALIDIKSSKIAKISGVGRGAKWKLAA